MRGGKRIGAGRPLGAKNWATAELRNSLSELARKHTKEAFYALLEVARDGQSERARISAANSILDRGYGKPKSDGVEVVELPAIVIQRAE
jgi:hypothetical protein